MDTKEAIEIIKSRSRFVAEINIDAIVAYKMAIGALEKQVFFENEVCNIGDWFVDNKDCLLDSATKVSTEGFKTLNKDGFIDDVDLDGIVEDIVDKIQEDILNVLDTFEYNSKQFILGG